MLSSALQQRVMIWPSPLRSKNARCEIIDLVQEILGESGGLRSPAVTPFVDDGLDFLGMVLELLAVFPVHAYGLMGDTSRMSICTLVGWVDPTSAILIILSAALRPPRTPGRGRPSVASIPNLRATFMALQSTGANERSFVRHDMVGVVAV